MPAYRNTEPSDERHKGQDLPQLLTTALQQHKESHKAMQEQLQLQQADLHAMNFGLESGSDHEQKQQQQLLNMQVSQCTIRAANVCTVAWQA